MIITRLQRIKNFFSMYGDVCSSVKLHYIQLPVGKDLLFFVDTPRFCLEQTMLLSRKELNDVFLLISVLDSFASFHCITYFMIYFMIVCIISNILFFFTEISCVFFHFYECFRGGDGKLYIHIK